MVPDLIKLSQKGWLCAIGFPARFWSPRLIRASDRYRSVAASLQDKFVGTGRLVRPLCGISLD